MAASLTLTLALGACAAPAPLAPLGQAAAPGPLRVTNAGAPFRMWEGAAARRVAEATCAARGGRLQPSIYDRFEAGAWVYVGGCV